MLSSPKGKPPWNLGEHRMGPQRLATLKGGEIKKYPTEMIVKA